jgi:hypothetical protein
MLEVCEKDAVAKDPGNVPITSETSVNIVRDLNILSRGSQASDWRSHFIFMWSWFQQSAWIPAILVYLIHCGKEREEHK